MDTELMHLANLKKGLSNEERLQLDTLMSTRRKNPTTALILSLLIGSFGVDRFYIGDAGLGFVKLLTLGGLGIWTIVDWCLIKNATSQRNINEANQVRDYIIKMRP